MEERKLQNSYLSKHFVGTDDGPEMNADASKNTVTDVLATPIIFCFESTWSDQSRNHQRVNTHAVPNSCGLKEATTTDSPGPQATRFHWRDSPASDSLLACGPAKVILLRKLSRPGGGLHGTVLLPTEALVRRRGLKGSSRACSGCD